MPRDFYPFVEGDGEPSRTGSDAATSGDEAFEVHHPARIAVYDDAAAAPRVVVIEPTDVRSYLEEITSTVNRLSHEQGGSIPFMVIREIVENFIHAYFQAPTITILDGGDTIRFSDQGPGIKEKTLALEYGTSSATEEMKHYIRGVGSGLPYVHQYMVDKGGSLEIEDNISGGTVVTISTHAQDDDPPGTPLSGAPQAQQGPHPYQGWPGTGQWAASQQAWQPPYPYGAPGGAGYGVPGMPMQQQAAQGYPAQQPPMPGYPAQQQAMSPYAPQPQAQPAFAAPAAEYAPAASPYVMPQVTLDERGRQALSFLAGNLTAGPTELVRAFGASSATWSRALNGLAAQGLVTKNGQKYHLTGIGKTVAESL